MTRFIHTFFSRNAPPRCDCEVDRKVDGDVAKNRKLPDLRGVVLPAVAFAIWWAVSAIHGGKGGLLVTPEQVWHTTWQQVTSGALAKALGASLAREASGFAIGAILGLALGVSLGLSRLATRMIGPTFDTFKQISLFAWIPLISVWFGLGDAAKVVFLSLAALLPVAAHTCDGIHAVPRSYVEAARVFRYTRWQLVWHVILPVALPSIFTGLYLALIYSWLATLGAEYLLVAGIYSWLATLGAEYLLVAGSGIGNTLIDGSENFRMDLVLFGIVVVGVVGALLSGLARSAERAVLKRRGGALLKENV